MLFLLFLLTCNLQLFCYIFVNLTYDDDDDDDDEYDDLVYFRPLKKGVELPLEHVKKGVATP